MDDDDDFAKLIDDMTADVKTEAARLIDSSTVDWPSLFDGHGEPPSTFEDARLMAWSPRFGAVYRLQDDGESHVGGHRSLERSDLSEDQEEAVGGVLDWYRKVDGVLHSGNALALGGYAGTGKTTIVSLIAREVGAHNVAFVAYTGKAAAVLRRKLRAAGVYPGYCGTIHSCIYTPDVDEKTGRVVGWELRDWSQLYDSTRLIVCDEASMVDSRLWEDLRSYLVPVLAVGDPGQLPPVGRDTESPVANPDILLSKIHRQAHGNPVVEFATMVRNDDERWRTYETDDSRFRRVQRGSSEERSVVLELYRHGDGLDRAILCRYNKTRVGVNARVRESLGLHGTPRAGDVVTVLKNQNIEGTKVYNGMRGEVVADAVECGDHHVVVPIRFADDGVLLVAKASRHQFGFESTFRSYEEAEQAGHREIRGWSDLGILVDYAYALTVHKAQGSQYDEVVLFLEGSRRDSREDNLRWVYTGATRAADKLTVIG